MKKARNSRKKAPQSEAAAIRQTLQEIPLAQILALRDTLTYIISIRRHGPTRAERETELRYHGLDPSTLDGLNG